jgi:hypothetical protein
MPQDLKLNQHRCENLISYRLVNDWNVSLLLKTTVSDTDPFPEIDQYL